MALLPLRHNYRGHCIELLPVRPGVWRYRVLRLEPHPHRSTYLVPGPVIADTTTLTKANAIVRGRDIARRAHRRGARWPRSTERR